MPTMVPYLYSSDIQHVSVRLMLYILVAMVTDSQLLTQSILQLNADGEVSYCLLLQLH